MLLSQRIYFAVFCVHCAVLASACNQSANKPVTPPPAVSSDGSIRVTIPTEKPWSAHVLKQTDGSLVATLSHSKGLLEVWAIDSKRTLHPLAQGKAGYHPDGVRWSQWEGGDDSKSLLVAAEGAKEIQLWRYQHEALEKISVFKVDVAPQTLESADLDGDGQRDIVAGPYNADTVTVLWGKGNFKFDAMKLTARLSPNHPRIVDWDKDGRLDIVWSDWHAGSVRWAKNQGGRKFEIRELQPEGKGSPRQVAIGDVDGDGYPDLVMALEVGKAVRILYNDGHGGVSRQEEVPAPISGYSAAAVLGSGKEVMLALGEADMAVLARRAEGGGWKLRRFVSGSLPMDFQFVDADSDGQQDLLFANTASQSVEIIFGPLWESAQELPP